jgi:hypothetical protein
MRKFGSPTRTPFRVDGVCGHNIFSFGSCLIANHGAFSSIVTIHMHQTITTYRSPSALLIYLHCNNLQFVPAYLCKSLSSFFNVSIIIHNNSAYIQNMAFQGFQNVVHFLFSPMVFDGYLLVSTIFF